MKTYRLSNEDLAGVPRDVVYNPHSRQYDAYLYDKQTIIRIAARKYVSY